MKNGFLSTLVAAQMCMLVACATSGAPQAPATPAPVAAMRAAEPASAAAAANKAPPADCLAVLDRLFQGIPIEEMGPTLQSKGLRISTPIRVPDDVITEKSVTSAARVRVMIDNQGQVIPGSVLVQQAVGDPKLPLAMSDAVPATLRFDVSGAFTVPKEFAFTTVYANCARP